LRFHRLLPVGEVRTRSCCNRQRHRHRLDLPAGRIEELAPHEQVSATGSLRSNRPYRGNYRCDTISRYPSPFITILLVLAAIDVHVTYSLYLHLMPPRHHTRLLGRSHEAIKTGPATPATKLSHRIQIAIYCSENSNLPATHHRIITTRLTKKSDRRELKSQSQTDWGALVAHRVRRVSIAVSI
jgi:hypothetical protein